MSGFEDYARQTRQLEREIVRWGLVLGIDWNDAEQVGALARDAIAFKPAARGLPAEPGQRARVELFGLAQLMLTVMRESADEGILSHGGPAWKALGRALFEASGLGSRQ